jgi:hypothetical protein
MTVRYYSWVRYLVSAVLEEGAIERRELVVGLKAGSKRAVATFCLN